MTTSKPRGRPRTFDRQAALEAAMTLFWRHGYEGTSIADLTSAMGFTPPTLYAAFGSKEQLYREVLAHYLTRGQALSEDPCAYTAIEYHLRDAAEHFTNP